MASFSLSSSCLGYGEIFGAFSMPKSNGKFGIFDCEILKWAKVRDFVLLRRSCRECAGAFVATTVWP